MSTDKEKKPTKPSARPGKTAAKTTAAKVEKPKAAAKPKSAAATAKTAPKAAKTKAAPSTSEVHDARQRVSRPRPTHEQIAHVAYGYFLQRHGQHGHHDEDWLRAEQELLRLL